MENSKAALQRAIDSVAIQEAQIEQQRIDNTRAAEDQGRGDTGDVLDRQERDRQTLEGYYEQWIGQQNPRFAGGLLVNGFFVQTSDVAGGELSNSEIAQRTNGYLDNLSQQGVSEADLTRLFGERSEETGERLSESDVATARSGSNQSSNGGEHSPAQAIAALMAASVVAGRQNSSDDRR